MYPASQLEQRLFFKLSLVLNQPRDECVRALNEHQEIGNVCVHHGKPQKFIEIESSVDIAAAGGRWLMSSLSLS
jgi:hypothetical protein